MEECEFFVGTYSEPDAESIFLYRADFKNLEFTRLASHSGSLNPSYLRRRRNGMLYAVEELATGGYVSAYQADRSGIKKLCSLPSNGADPCHIELDDEEEYLFVANYSSGSCALFELDEEGLIKGPRDLKRHEGVGANPARQEAPHVHFSKFLDGLLYVCDLGLDTVFCYKLNRGEKLLEKTPFDIKMPGGNGPRHLCFNPLDADYLYVAAELTAKVFVFHRENGRYIPRQTICSLPGGVPPENRTAAIKFSDDGKYLFVSNRGHDSITVFDASDDGALSVLDICETGGKGPRDFSLFGDYCVVGNQDSSLLTVLLFDRKTNRIGKMPMREEVVHPVCILGG